MSDAKPVGLTLDPEFYEKLRVFAFERALSLSAAARMIVAERLGRDPGA